MQVRALKTFAGKLGLVRTGMVITVDERYGKQLLRNKLVVVEGAQTNDPNDSTLKPDRDTDLGGPESTKDDDGQDGDEGKDQGPDDPEKDESSDEKPEGSSQDQGSGSDRSSSEDRPAGGRARPLSSPRAGRRSRKKT